MLTGWCSLMCPVPFSRHSATSLNAPSGIAQLRKSSEQSLPQAEPMNLDEFIVSESVATPAAFPLSPQPPPKPQVDEAAAKPAHSLTTAIPIKSRKDSSQHFIPQSMPLPPHNQRFQDDFSYVSRHPRKTSIDERRVSYPAVVRPFCMSTSRSLACPMPAINLQP